MMTRPPVSMWPTAEHAYKGFGEVLCVINPAQQKRTVNTAAAPGAKETYLYNDLAEQIYDEARRNVSGNVRELREGKCHRKSVTGAKTKATDTCEHFQR